jgi:hypothetical protein
MHTQHNNHRQNESIQRGQQVTAHEPTATQTNRQATSPHQAVRCPLNDSGKEVSSPGCSLGPVNIITTVYSCTVQMRACSRWMRCEVRLGYSKKEKMSDKRGDAVSSEVPVQKSVWCWCSTCIATKHFLHTQISFFERKITCPSSPPRARTPIGAWPDTMQAMRREQMGVVR